jgi:hypothetical protein
MISGQLAWCFIHGGRADLLLTFRVGKILFCTREYAVVSELLEEDRSEDTYIHLSPATWATFDEVTM